MKLLEPQDQGQTYVDKLNKIGLSRNDPAPNIEVDVVIGAGRRRSKQPGPSQIVDGSGVA